MPQHYGQRPFNQQAPQPVPVPGQGPVRGSFLPGTPLGQALIAAGSQLGQPAAPGVSPIGQLGQAVGAGGRAFAGAQREAARGEAAKAKAAREERLVAVEEAKVAAATAQAAQSREVKELAIRMGIRADLLEQTMVVDPLSGAVDIPKSLLSYAILSRRLFPGEDTPPVQLSPEDVARLQADPGFMSMLSSSPELLEIFPGVVPAAPEAAGVPGVPTPAAAPPKAGALPPPPVVPTLDPITGALAPPISARSGVGTLNPKEQQMLQLGLPMEVIAQLRERGLTQ